MIKVFLVEDEMVIRNAIKNSIDWEKEGYEFVGEAGDGELAYPLILKRQPDILITDIKMPFMDGLELSAAVKKELPGLKILILSGYNDFEYAKTAIGIGVTDYLLKPVSAEMLLESLAGIREMIQKESQNKELLRKYEEEMQENFEKQKTEVLGKLITGRFSTMEALDLGKSIGLDVSVAYQSFLLFKIMFYEMGNTQQEDMIQAFVLIEEIFQNLPGAFYFERGIEGWALILGADTEAELEELQKSIITSIEKTMTQVPSFKYFGGCGSVASRVSDLPQAFRDAEKSFSYRFTAKPNQIVRWNVEESAGEPEIEMSSIASVEESRELIESFLRRGSKEEVVPFVNAYLDSLSPDYLESEVMRQYLIMDIHVSMASFAEKINLDPAEIQSISDISTIIKNTNDKADIRDNLVTALETLFTLRDAKSDRKYADVIETAKEHILQHYMTGEITLNTVAKKVGMSPSYFSSIFSQEMGQTFVEFLTSTRMEKAKELLLCTSMKTSDIGYEVGYKDSHYFSYIFKKVNGVTPKEFRMHKEG